MLPLVLITRRLRRRRDVWFAARGHLFKKLRSVIFIAGWSVVNGGPKLSGYQRASDSRLASDATRTVPTPSLWTVVRHDSPTRSVIVRTDASQLPLERATVNCPAAAACEMLPSQSASTRWMCSHSTRERRHARRLGRFAGRFLLERGKNLVGVRSWSVPVCAQLMASTAVAMLPYPVRMTITVVGSSRRRSRTTSNRIHGQTKVDERELRGFLVRRLEGGRMIRTPIAS